MGRSHSHRPPPREIPPRRGPGCRAFLGRLRPRATAGRRDPRREYGAREMMDTLPTHWLALVGVVFLLGLKHGLDPDHLAAIDGLTRFNAARRPGLSRW